MLFRALIFVSLLVMNLLTGAGAYIRDLYALSAVYLRFIALWLPLKYGFNGKQVIGTSLSKPHLAWWLRARIIVCVRFDRRTVPSQIFPDYQNLHFSSLAFFVIASKFAQNSVLQLSHGWNSWRSGNYTHHPSEKLCLAYGEKKKELGELKKQLRSDDDERVHIVANDSQHDTAWS